jgi:transcriptional regulator with XRE-family HTH domain
MVAKNFKFLYRYCKDKQEVLAQMFGVPQSNISAYVNGTKPIPINILQKIADRYGLTTDDLLNKDLSLEFDTPQTIELKDAMAFGKNMHPILTSNISKTNDDFNRAHKILLEALAIERIGTFYERVSVLEHAIDLFQKTWKETNSYVALSNSLSTILLICACYNQQNIKIGQELIEKGSVTFFDIQSALLRNPCKPNVTHQYEKKQQELFEKYDELAYENIKHLKSNAFFSELGDYYLALCYFVGFAEEHIEYEQCVQTGLHMLIQLYKLDNKYANKFLDALP